MKNTNLILSMNLTIICIILFTDICMSQNMGNALEFDGVDDFVFIGNDTTLQVNQFTLTAWVYPYSYSDPLPNESRMEILEKTDEYWMNISTVTHPPDKKNRRDKGEVRVGGFFGDKDAWYFLDSEYIVPLNEWTHVACTYDNDSLTLYINGQYEAAMEIPEDYTSQQDTLNYLALGCKNKFGPDGQIEAQFHGMLDEISIWDTALSVIDIQDLMNSGIQESHPHWDRLVAYYKFDEDKIGQNDGLIYDEKGLNNGANYGAYWVSNSVTFVEEMPTLVQHFVLQQNYPNPFNPVTNIRFIIPQPDFVKLNVYDVNGRVVEKLVSGRLNKGEYIVQWNASNLPSGTYFYKIESANFSQTKKCILIK